MTFDPFTLAGVAGTALIIVAYFANQRGRLRSDDWPFPLANLIGSLMILLTLVTAWNFSLVVIESFWAAISAYGLIRSVGLLRRR
ncbi:MAG: hypothetical protein AB7V40_01965 [Methyloceanibacter sp.]